MLGKRIKEARKAIGKSAEDVAMFLGVSAATVYRYENGSIEKIPMNHLVPLSAFLKVSPSYLMGIDDHAGSKQEETKIPASLDPPEVVVPDNELFVKAYEVMTYQDRVMLTDIFNRAFEKMKEENPDSK